MTDEEDCSLRENDRLFFAAKGDPTYRGVGIHYRCAAFPETQLPISRYIENLRALRPTMPGSIFYAAITGYTRKLGKNARAWRALHRRRGEVLR